MLDGLDQIDWSRLSHAGGPEIDIPALIRRLADGSSEDRDATLAELFASIWHQGTVFEATAYAVPFLIELATDPAVPDRSHFLELLRAIAEGWLDCQKNVVLPGKFVSAKAAEREVIERRSQQAAHAAVAKGLTALSELLADEQAEVRVFTAFVLALLTEHAAEVAEMLLEAADREADDACRSMLQFALVRLAQNTGSPALTEVVVRRLTSVFDETSSELAALGAGIGLLELEQNVVISRVLHLARPRLVSESDVFQSINFPGSTPLYWLVNESLKFAPREQLKWIVEGLSHTDQEVRVSAMGCGINLCREFRWPPSELVPVYAQLIERVDADERRLTLQYMRNTGRAGAVMLETLKQHRLADVRDNAALQLNRIETNPEDPKSWLVEKRPVPLPAVVALMKTMEALQGSRKWRDEQLCDAVIQLGFHGQDAHAAIETLRAFTQRESPWLRVHSIRALWRITQDPDLVVPLLAADLAAQPVVFLVVDCFKQVGSAARAVAPELRQILDAERRFFRQGWVDPCGLDEAFCDACAAALDSIEATG